jgi:hypothetical protein
VGLGGRHPAAAAGSTGRGREGGREGGKGVSSSELTPPRTAEQEVAFFDQSKTGELMNRLSADTTGR